MKFQIVSFILFVNLIIVQSEKINEIARSLSEIKIEKQSANELEKTIKTIIKAVVSYGCDELKESFTGNNQTIIFFHKSQKFVKMIVFMQYTN